MGKDDVTLAALAASNEEQHDRIEEKVDLLLERFERHERLLYGNGQEGLKVMVDRNTSTLGGIKKGMWIVFTVLAGIVAAILFP